MLPTSWLASRSSTRTIAEWSHAAPPWAQAALAFTPAPAVFQTPIDVFLERGDPLGALAGQLVWVVLLLAVGRVVLRRGARRLVVQGG